ncbi:MAG: response regulator transcription factor [Desulfosarcinaceae bacterium]|nr:response regulator transcription factor [Desulfosarcinaceae bacterium]
MTAFHVLVVDDDPDILTIIRDNLDLDGYTVTTAATGREALARFAEVRPDLLVLDLMLPDLDGLQICRRIRRESQVPIILLTAKDAVSDKVLGLESGADDYLVKPFDYLELAARIKARLRRGGNYRKLSEMTAVGDWELVPDRREVAINGRFVRLTKKEFDLLSLLFKHAGQALDRETIRRSLWPDAKIYHWSRTIDVHIQHLRAKLEQTPDQPTYITTVPGVGYLLKPPAPSADLRRR